MNFTPKKNEELNTFELFPKGEYAFKVIKAFDTTSKAGNSQIKLELDIYANDDSEKKTRVYDYLLENMASKLKHFCEMVGLKSEYAAGYIDAEMCKEKSGKCILEIDCKEGYSDKNIVKDYCKQSISTDPLDDINQDEIPF